MAFDNEERRRYYGLRKGDIVSPRYIHGIVAPKAEVIDYGMDNNRVRVKFENGEETEWVAEWCDIIEKVEDRKK